MSKLSLSLILFLAIFTQQTLALNPKREFRGAWLHTVYQDQYLKQSTEQNKNYLISQLDELQRSGVNVILFQVRPSADAFYNSSLEPWSRFLTKNGQAPTPYWDPLEFMLTECHKRGMELHAWLNPYRLTTAVNEKVAQGHIFYEKPGRFIKFNKRWYFDPGIPENRDYIAEVVMDIINKYDIDGLHFDDYFYPYPVAGVTFDDSASFAKYGNGMKKNDWRRSNVDKLIEEIHLKISQAKPWVRFGVSPFGIWRNKTSDARGSNTNGLENYDSLYADVLLWDEKGWVDYLIPQLYWETTHKKASYSVLIDWWNNAVTNHHLYIGQDVDRTMKANELNKKIAQERCHQNVSGNCWWPGYEITKNNAGICDSLSNNYQSTIALVPNYPWISDKKPATVKNIKIKHGKLTWNKFIVSGRITDITKFVVYQFSKNDEIDISNPKYIVAITYSNSYDLDDNLPAGTKFVVTALDRVNNESDASNAVTIK
jgi:uncharacterized lipoprotein YddW (UPF0748 family)